MTEPILLLEPAAGPSALVRAALGPLNVGHYLRVFARFDAEGRRGLVWHRHAALFTLGWMVLRRLWREAAVYAAVVVAVAALVGWGWPRLAAWPAGVRLGVLGGLLLAWFLVPGWLGHAWLHRRVQRRVLAAVAQSSRLADAQARLAADGVGPERLRRVVTGHGLLLSALLFLGAWLPWRPAEDAPTAPQAPVLRGETAPVAQPSVPVPSPEPQAAVPSEPTPAPVPVAAPDAVAPLSSAAPAGSHGINVGLFANPDNAHRAHQRLLQAQLPATVEVLNTAKGERFRVRVGPFADAAAADAAAQRVRTLGLEAAVFRQP